MSSWVRWNACSVPDMVKGLELLLKCRLCGVRIVSLLVAKVRAVLGIGILR